MDKKLDAILEVTNTTRKEYSAQLQKSRCQVEAD